MGSDEFPLVAFDLEHLQSNAHHHPEWLFAMYHVMVTEYGFNGLQVFAESEGPSELGVGFLKVIADTCTSDDSMNNPDEQPMDHVRTIIEEITEHAILFNQAWKGESNGHT